MNRKLLIAVCCMVCRTATAQVLPPGFDHKLSPRLLQPAARAGLPAGRPLRFLLQCSDTAQLQRLLAGKKDSIRIDYVYANVLAVTAYPALVYNRLLPLPYVNFIDINERKAKEEATINGFDYTTNYINKLHSARPAITGKDNMVLIKENKPDMADIDFKGRFVSTSLSGGSLSSHATIMGTIIAGGGNSFYTARGIAPGAALGSSSFAILLPDSDAAYRRYGVMVQNHSYGTGIENYYGADAAAYDASVVNNPSLLHVFSSGNSGDQSPTLGAYKGIAGRANLTGSFKMAKNIITVGSIDSFYTVALLSSKGPAYDGRVKPELVAYGEDGSSGAAALVSGTALLLQQVYKEQHGGQAADAALVKAVLLNTAGEAGSKGIDFLSGFGSLDAWRAVKELQAGHFFSGTVAPAQSQAFSLSLPANVKNLKLLLSWTDPPAAANAPAALVNDLDLALVHTASAQSWQPWVLNSAARADSLSLPPVRKRDSLNNVEQVTVDDPPAGDYTITVNGYHIPLGAQHFFVVYQWDTARGFEWMYPAAGDNLLPGQPNLLRWQSNAGGSGAVEYQLAGSSHWLSLQPTAGLAAGYLSWTVPDTSATALLRMTINGIPYISDSFTISPRPATGVGFNCPDSFLLYWNKGVATGYTLFRLGAQYLEPIQTTADTSIVLPASPALSNWYAVAALLPFNKTGLRSLAFDYTQQGVGCYISNFTADLAGNAAALELGLGSDYHTNAISVEKQYPGGYRLLNAWAPPFGLHYSMNDTALVQGLNTYRVKIVLSNGQVIYSEPETVYYFGNSAYIVYPNPVAQRQSIHIVSAGLNNPVFRLFNASGQLVMQKTLYNLAEDIPIAGLPKGFYFYTIVKDGKRDAAGKIIVQ